MWRAYCIALYGKPMWDHAVLTATWHMRMHPALTPAKQAGTRFTVDHGRMERAELCTIFIMLTTYIQQPHSLMWNLFKDKVSMQKLELSAHSLDSNCRPHMQTTHYTVSQERIPDIIKCNLKKDYQFLIVFLVKIFPTQLATKWLLKLPPHPASVPALPGKIRTSKI